MVAVPSNLELQKHHRAVGNSEKGVVEIKTRHLFDVRYGESVCEQISGP